MTTNILLLSRDNEQAEMIRGQLQAHRGYEVFIENSAKGALTRMKSTAIRAIIMNSDNFGFNQLMVVNQIRELGYSYKIIIFANKIQHKAYNIVEKISNVAIFGKAFVDLEKDCAGLVKRFLTQEKIAKRVSKRHLAEQRGMLKKSKGRDLVNCTVSNLSKTGAYIEFEKGLFNIGDSVQIIIPLTDLSKTHIVNCKITWLQVSSNGQKSAGLHFLK